MEFVVTTVATGLGFTNKLYFHPDDIKRFPSPKNYIYLSKHKQFYSYSPDARVPVGSVAIPQAQLLGLNLQPQVDRIKVDWYVSNCLLLLLFYVLLWSWATADDLNQICRFLGRLRRKDCRRRNSTLP